MSSQSSIRFNRSVPVRHEVDVFVAGGGPGGVAAAVAAARQGASVYLAEGMNCLGGLGTAGMVPAFMTFSDGIHFLADGIGREIVERLDKAGGVHDTLVGRKTLRRGASIRCEVLKRVYDEMVVDAGVRVTFHTQLIGVQTSGRKVTAAILAAKSGLFAVKAKVFIDGTGDGDLCAWAGAPFEKGDKNGDMMAGTMCSLWADVDLGKFFKNGKWKWQGEFLAKAYRDGVFTREDLHLPGMWQVWPNVGGGNIGHTFDVDGTDERSLTEALLWGRQSLTEYERYYKDYLKGFEKMCLVATGSILGIRETRRIMGDYVLCLDDFKNRESFDDEIGRYSYPVDIHASRAGKAAHAKFWKEYTTFRYKDGESYGVPYRCLTPRGLSNVLVVGRCVSTDRYMQSSIRVMPGCYITGQAAGAAAAMAAGAKGKALGDVRAVDIRKLQQRLVKMGAYLPNAK